MVSGCRSKYRFEPTIRSTALTLSVPLCAQSIESAFAWWYRA